MFIISDAHISEDHGGKSDEFFRMLLALEKSDDDIVFLGDIFDLWIALPRYEQDIHRRFLVWCAAQKRRRRVGFVEGNHEYFLARNRSRFFSWCTDAAWWRDEDGNLFCHGDQVNLQDRNYMLFRRVAKSGLSRFLMRLLPGGPHLTKQLRVRLTNTNQKFRRRLPLKAIATFADSRFKDGTPLVFVGHFHKIHSYRDSRGRTLHTVPWWFENGIITRFDTDAGTVRYGEWKTLLS